MSARGTSATSRYYYLEDGLGNVRFVTDEVGNKVRSNEFDPYGFYRSANGQANIHMLFQGQQQDPESSLYYLRARYYDPVTGRFISRDPVEGKLSLPQTQNPYAYSLNNPVNLSDPSGKAVGLLYALDAAGTAADAYSLGRDLSNCNWGGAALSAASLAVPFVSIGAIRLADEAIDAAKALNVTFQTEHGMRHFGGTNLTSDVIESAIKSDVLSKGGAGRVGENVERIINVQGTDIIYRANMWKDGVVNVGTYFLKP